MDERDVATYRPPKMASPEQNLAAAPLPAHVDVAIIGAGFSGLGAAIKLRQAGRHDFVVLERAGEVGGTWEANRYPGCQCDVPSNLYSFSFAPNPDWSQTFALQPEIWRYLRRVADEFGLRPQHPARLRAGAGAAGTRTPGCGGSSPRAER